MIFEPIIKKSFYQITPVTKKKIIKVSRPRRIKRKYIMRKRKKNYNISEEFDEDICSEPIFNLSSSESNSNLSSMSINSALNFIRDLQKNSEISLDSESFSSENSLNSNLSYYSKNQMNNDDSLIGDSYEIYNHRPIVNYNIKHTLVSSTPLTWYDLQALSFFGMTKRDVVNINNVSDKLSDLEILLSKSRLPDSLLSLVKKKKKPSVVDIYTFVQYKYRNIPDLWNRISNKKKKHANHYVTIANKMFPNLFNLHSFGKKKKANNFFNLGTNIFIFKKFYQINNKILKFK